MTAARTDLFNLAERRLAWLGAKQNALASNIANANTPGYVATDVVSFQKVLSGYSSLSPSRTQQNHLSGTIAEESVPVEPDKQTIRSIDGNSVLLDQQLTEVSATASDQSLVASIWKKYASMLNTALGR
jgi:flagellar basal-body rod protein FlgB